MVTECLWGLKNRLYKPDLHRSTTAPLNPETPLQGALSGTNGQGQPCEHWVQRYAWNNEFKQCSGGTH